MLIVVEGIDGSGKSTLIDRIVSQLHEDTNVIHRGPLRRSPLEEYEADLYDAAYRTTVCDRWHVGELFYGPLYRGQSQLSQAQARHVEMFLDSRGALKLMLDTPYEEVMRRLEFRGEDFLQPQHRSLAWDFYREYATVNDWSLVPSNYTYTDVANIIATAEENSVAMEDYASSYVGPWNPKYLLVLDERVDLPEGTSSRDIAASPLRGSAEHYLMAALTLAGASEVGIITARRYSSIWPEHRNWFHDQWVLMNSPRVITLGRSAERIVRETGVEHMATFSPEHVRTRCPHSVADWMEEMIRYGNDV